MRAHASIREMLAEGMRESGVSEEEIQAQWTAERQMLERIETRKWGYAGWLVTNPDFHRARDMFRQQWEGKVASLERLPTLPMSFAGEAPEYPEEKDRPFFTAYTSFYRQWSLHSLATWDLPIPMRPELVHPSLYHQSALVGAGLPLFIPWYLLRDKDLKVRELAARTLTVTPQVHLRDWLEGKRDWGYERFSVMLQLYVYLELGLRARYGHRLKRQTERIDYALGRFFAKDPSRLHADITETENIRKIRQEMDRRLKRCVPA